MLKAVCTRSVFTIPFPPITKEFFVQTLPLPAAPGPMIPVNRKRINVPTHSSMKHYVPKSVDFGNVKKNGTLFKARQESFQMKVFNTTHAPAVQLINKINTRCNVFYEPGQKRELDSCISAGKFPFFESMKVENSLGTPRSIFQYVHKFATPKGTNSIRRLKIRGASEHLMHGKLEHQWFYWLSIPLVLSFDLFMLVFFIVCSRNPFLISKLIWNRHPSRDGFCIGLHISLSKDMNGMREATYIACNECFEIWYYVIYEMLHEVVNFFRCNRQNALWTFFCTLSQGYSNSEKLVIYKLRNARIEIPQEAVPPCLELVSVTWSHHSS